MHGAKLWLEVWLYSRLEDESLEPKIDFLALQVPKLWPEDRSAEYFPAIALINFCLFCHNFWDRTARKSINPSNDSSCSLESKKTLSHKISSIVRLSGDDAVIQM